MPRSIQEILAHAEALAKQFEDYDPSVGDERPVEEYLLQRAALARAHSERQMTPSVELAHVSRRLLGPGFGRRSLGPRRKPRSSGTAPDGVHVTPSGR